MKKKIFTLLAALVLSMGIGWAATKSQHFDYSEVTTARAVGDNGSGNWYMRVNVIEFVAQKSNNDVLQLYFSRTSDSNYGLYSGNLVGPYPGTYPLYRSTYNTQYGLWVGPANVNAVWVYNTYSNGYGSTKTGLFSAVRYSGTIYQIRYGNVIVKENNVGKLFMESDADVTDYNGNNTIYFSFGNRSENTLNLGTGTMNLAASSITMSASSGSTSANIKLNAISAGSYSKSSFDLSNCSFTYNGSVKTISDISANVSINAGIYTMVATIRDNKDNVYFVTLSAALTTTPTVTINTPTNGTIVVKDANNKTITSGMQVEKGTVLTVTATPATDCLFSAWTGGITTTSTEGNVVTGTITVDNSVTIGATFTECWKYTIEISPNSGSGLITITDVNTGVVYYNDHVTKDILLPKGCKVSIVGKPDAGSKVKFAYFSNDYYTTEHTFTSSYPITASNTWTFELIALPPTVTITQPTGGTIEVTDANGQTITSGTQVEKGTVLNVKLTTDFTQNNSTASKMSGYVFTGWKNGLTVDNEVRDFVRNANGVPQGKNLITGTVTINANTEIAATLQRTNGCVFFGKAKSKNIPGNGKQIIKDMNGNVLYEGESSPYFAFAVGTQVKWSIIPNDTSYARIGSGNKYVASVIDSVYTFSQKIIEKVTMIAKPRIKMDAMEHGTVTMVSTKGVELHDGDYLDYKDSIVVTAVPDFGYHWSKWNSYTQTYMGNSGDNTVKPSFGDNATYRYVTIGATFAPNKHTLTWNLDGGTITTAGTAAGQVAYGTALVAPTVEKAGYNFTGWNPAVAATMPDDDVTYTAQWEQAATTVTVMVASSENGNIKVAQGDYVLYNGNEGDSFEVDYGTELTLTAIADAKYQFATWTNTEASAPNAPRRAPQVSWGDGEASMEIEDKDLTTNPLTLTITGDLSFGATFEQLPTKTVTINETVNGSIQVSDGTTTVTEAGTYAFREGATLTLTLVPAGGLYDYGEWVNEDYETISEEQVRKITLTEDIDLYADFMKGEFTLIESGDDANYNNLPDVMVRRVILQRSIAAGRWSTMCLPFDNWLEGTANYGKIHEMTGATVNGGVVDVTFSKVSSFSAGTPYMYYSATATDNIVFNYVTFDKTAVAGSIERGDLTYYGVLFTPAVIPANNLAYRYIATNKLYYPTKELTMTFDRGYFHMSKLFENAPIRMFIDDNMITGAEEQQQDLEAKKYIEEGNLIIERNGVKYDAQGKQL